MATKQHAQRLARKLGVELLTNPDYGQGEVLAPKGKWWYASGCRAFCVDYGYRGGMSLVYDELIEAMRDGMTDAPAGCDE